jgi:hypothetical protein
VFSAGKYKSELEIMHSLREGLQRKARNKKMPILQSQKSDQRKLFLGYGKWHFLRGFAAKSLTLVVKPKKNQSEKIGILYF